MCFVSCVLSLQAVLCKIFLILFKGFVKYHYIIMTGDVNEIFRVICVIKDKKLLFPEPPCNWVMSLCGLCFNSESTVNIKGNAGPPQHHLHYKTKYIYIRSSTAAQWRHYRLNSSQDVPQKSSSLLTLIPDEIISQLK